jgi:hypothetical protein
MAESDGTEHAGDLEAQLRDLEDAENKVVRLLQIASDVAETLADPSSNSGAGVGPSSDPLLSARERLQADTADFLRLIQEVLLICSILSFFRS